MKALLQRVRQASVEIDGAEHARIARGLVGLIGIAPEDDETAANRLLERMLGYRLFPDSQGRMNASLDELSLGLLLVPNFTLMADTRKGRRPSFAGAAPPEQAAPLFAHLCRQAAARCPEFGAGVFGADMQVALINDGPVTVLLEVC